MALIVEGTGTVFDSDSIGKGWLIYAKHESWDEGKVGYVTAVSEEKIIVQYLAPIGNITNHFQMKASEVADGEWEVRWSEDLTEICEYPESEGSGSGMEENDDI